MIKGNQFRNNSLENRSENMNMTKLSKIVLLMMVLCMPNVRAEGIESIADRVMKKIGI